MEDDQIPSAPSTPMTPGTPGAPLFGKNHHGFRPDMNNGKKPNSIASLLKNSKCFKPNWSNDVEEGSLPSLSCSIPSPPISLSRKVGAEFIGTLILIFSGTATAIVNQKSEGSETLIGLAASTGLAVMVVILSTGHISGAHLNPAVTISFAALKHFPWKHVPMYVLAQVLASICAAFALKGIFDPVMAGGVTVPAEGTTNVQAFGLEFIISFNLMFVVTAVATDTRSVGELAGIAVGATVMLNILIAGGTTGASMNPVRTLGPAIAANNFKGFWIYCSAPFLGALAGAGVYSAVKLPENYNDDDDHHANPTAGHSFRRS
ncbi:aquaporin NIP6-1 [Impatiens glandulifera]|uniref:aquaporin NIP6-1 n=1 Tax=Impatiens glandulifera TaxID=253017 RepID=UPI001FB10EF6|nr:aquaporin NIP6-1 [Impatiens glandulifera]